MALWLSVDQGGHATRAVVFDASGAVVARAEAAVATHRHGLYVEHDPAELIGSVRECIAVVARQLGARRAEVAAAGLATQRSSLVCLQRSTGRPLTPVLSWQDRRALSELRPPLDPARIAEVTGLRLTAHYGAPKLRWLLRNEPVVQAAARGRDLIVAPLATFLIHALTGTADWRIDPANASRMLLMDAERIEWSPELMRMFEAEPDQLPKILPSRADYGAIAFGDDRVPLCVVTGDQSAALFCTGLPASGTAFVNIGTGAFLQTVVGSALCRHARLLSSIVWVDGSTRLYVLEGTVNGAGAAIDDQQSALHGGGEVDWDGLARALVRPGRRGIFLNGVSGLGSPDWVADFPSRYLYATATEDRLAAVVESIGFLVLRNLETMRTRVAIERLLLGGGLARLEPLAQLIATLSGQTVLRLAEPEATARGLAFLTSEERLRAGAVRLARFEPVPDPELEQRYAAWCAAMEEALRAQGGGSPVCP